MVRNSDGSLVLKVYRKPTHTNQYLHFSSHHPLHQKLGVVNTLRNRCETIVTREEDRISENQLLNTALSTCGYPTWALGGHPKRRHDPETPADNNERKCVVVLPYTQGVSEKVCRIYKKHGVDVAFRPGNTLRSLLVKPKDITPPHLSCGVVYQVNCASCEATYVGESGRQLKTRIEEHRKSVRTGSLSSAISEHVQEYDHRINWESVNIIDRDDRFIPRKIREAIQIKRTSPFMNRDVGLELPPIYNRILTTHASSHTSSSQESEIRHSDEDC